MMKTYETPDMQVASLVPGTAVATSMGDNFLPLSSIVPTT